MIENCVMEGWHPDGYPGNLAYSPELWEWMFELGLYLNFDPSHLLWLGIDPVAALRPYVDRVAHAHAKDAETFPRAAQPLRLLRPHRRRASRTRGTWAGGATASPASAQVDFRRYVDALYEGGFDGVLSVEHEDPVWGGTPELVEAGPRIAHAQPPPAGGRDDATILEVRGLVKEYPGVKALQGVDLDVARGRGPLPARAQRRRQVDADQVRLRRGRADRAARSSSTASRCPPATPPGRSSAASRRSTRSSTSSTDLTVAESIFLAHEPRRGPLLDLDRMYRESAALLARLGHESIPPRAKVGRCGRRPSRSSRSPARCRATCGC